MLLAIGVEFDALDVSALSERDDNILVRLDVLASELAEFFRVYYRATLTAVLTLKMVRLFDDFRTNLRGIFEKRLEPLDEFEQFFVLVLEFFSLKSRQSAQLHVQDRLSLNQGESELGYQARACLFDIG